MNAVEKENAALLLRKWVDELLTYITTHKLYRLLPRGLKGRIIRLKRALKEFDEKYGLR